MKSKTVTITVYRLHGSNYLNAAKARVELSTSQSQKRRSVRTVFDSIRSSRNDDRAEIAARSLYPERQPELNLCLLPISATEQHGPHLGVGKESRIATLLSEAVSRETGAPVLPTLSYGCSNSNRSIRKGKRTRRFVA